VLGVRIKQYVLFVMHSDRLAPDEISREVGLVADEVALRGSRSVDPPRPISNVWRLRSDGAGLAVDDHVRRLIERLGPSKSAIRALLDCQADVRARFEVVRYFNAEDGEDEVIGVAGGLVKLAGQHQLLGWQLTREMLQFFADIDADLWVDEYG
jgi:hypothetical protein